MEATALDNPPHPQGVAYTNACEGGHHVPPFCVVDRGDRL